MNIQEKNPFCDAAPEIFGAISVEEADKDPRFNEYFEEENTWRQLEVKMYHQYLPDLIQKWQNHHYSDVAKFLLEKQYHYLPFICADLYQTTEDPIQDLIQLTAELAIAESVGLEPHARRAQILESRIEELVEEWAKGRIDNQDPYDQVAQQLLGRPRCETISFCAALLLKHEKDNERDEWNMFRLGLLAGAFVKNNG